jgi:hypothetical protein
MKHTCTDQSLSRVPRKVGVLTKSVTISDLRPYFEMTLEDAAVDFGASVAHMKRLCRKCQIKKWPYRQLKGITETINQLVEAYKSPLCSYIEKEKIDARLHCLREKHKKIINDPANLDTNGFVFAEDGLQDPKLAPASDPLYETTMRHQQQMGEDLFVTNQTNSSLSSYLAQHNGSNVRPLNALLAPSSSATNALAYRAGRLPQSATNGSSTAGKSSATAPASLKRKLSSNGLHQPNADTAHHDGQSLSAMSPLRQLQAIIANEGFPSAPPAGRARNAGMMLAAGVAKQIAPTSSDKEATETAINAIAAVGAAYLSSQLTKGLTGGGSGDPNIARHYQHIHALLQQNVLQKQQLVEMRNDRKSLTDYILQQEHRKNDQDTLRKGMLIMNNPKDSLVPGVGAAAPHAVGGATAPRSYQDPRLDQIALLSVLTNAALTAPGNQSQSQTAFGAQIAGLAGQVNLSPILMHAQAKGLLPPLQGMVGQNLQEAVAVCFEPPDNTSMPSLYDIRYECTAIVQDPSTSPFL